jgi:hypothetical protein
MRFFDYLQEEYTARITGSHYGYKTEGELFVNPTPKELKSLKTEGVVLSVRFIVNFKTKKLYVWRDDIVHYETAKILYKQQLIPSMNLNSKIFWKDCFAGIGDVYGNGKIELTGVSDYFISTDREYFKWLKLDDSWISQWFEGSLIDEIKNQWHLKEEYVGRITGSHWGTGRSVAGEIFENPSVKEIKSIPDTNYVRFIINFTTKKLYVWTSSIVHYEVAELLYNSKLIPTEDLRTDAFWNTCFAGVGDLQGSKIEYSGISDYGYHIDPGEMKYLWNNTDDKWLNKWFTAPFVKTAIIKEHFDLKEEYVGSVDTAAVGSLSFGGFTEIFKNPTPKEIKSIDAHTSERYKGMVRFIADYTQKCVFVFKCNMFHLTIHKYLEKIDELKYSSNLNDAINRDFIWGSAKVKSNGKMEYDYSDTVNIFEGLFKDKNVDDNWTKKWFTEPLITAIKRSY